MSVGLEDRSLRLLHGLIVSLQIDGIPKALETLNFRFQRILTALHNACVSIPKILLNYRSTALTRMQLNAVVEV